MKKMRLNSKVRKAFQGSSRGFSLIELAIAIALIGVLAVAIMGALSYASTVLIITDRQATAESLAKSQMEYIKNQDYIDYSESGHEDYDVIEENPYAVEVVAEPIDPDTYQPYPYIEGDGRFQQDDGIQKIKVIVGYDIVRSDRKVVEEQFILEGYKRQPADYTEV